MANNTSGTHDAYKLGPQGTKPAGGTPKTISFRPGGSGIKKVDGGGMPPVSRK